MAPTPSGDEEGGSGDGIGRRGRRNADKLVGRFPITTLVEAVAAVGDNRRKLLERFVKGNPQGTYTPTRKLFRRIYGSHGPIDGADGPLFADLPADPWPVIDQALRDACDADVLYDNLTVARMLFDHARKGQYVATNIDRLPLQIGRSKVQIGLDFYLTQGERLIFQFPHLRAAALTRQHATILGSLVHLGLVTGDYSAADVEIISFATDPKRRDPAYPDRKLRVPHLQLVERADMWSRAELQEEIDDVYDILWAIARS